MKISDLKIGQIVLINPDITPCDECEGEIVFIPTDDYIDGTRSVVVRIKCGWKENHILESYESLVLERLGSDAVYGGWFVELNDIQSILFESDIYVKSTKSIGGNCKVCNEYNEYQDGPYMCYRHNH